VLPLTDVRAGPHRSDVSAPLAKIDETDCNALAQRIAMRWRNEQPRLSFEESYDVRSNAQGMSWSMRACGWSLAIASSVVFIQA
jgi:hypothetical protein